MATQETSARRLVLAAGFVLAVAAAPAVTAFSTPSVGPAPYVLACPAGEEGDLYTGVCVPHTVPNAGSPFSTPLGNPNIVEIDGIPCTGHNSGQCIGLAEDAPKYVPPTSSESNSPTVTGSIG